jgi:hypothetical protein
MFEDFAIFLTLDNQNSNHMLANYYSFVALFSEKLSALAAVLAFLAVSSSTTSINMIMPKKPRKRLLSNFVHFTVPD